MSSIGTPASDSSETKLWRSSRSPVGLGLLPNMQGNGRYRVTDRLECPECRGSGRQVIGPLQMSCAFCQGLGYVGGDSEPAEEGQPLARTVRPVWEEPAVRVLTVRRVCLGARKVVNLGGTGEPTGKLVEMPCPACSKPDEDYQDKHPDFVPSST